MRFEVLQTGLLHLARLLLFLYVQIEPVPLILPGVQSSLSSLQLGERCRFRFAGSGQTRLESSHTELDSGESLAVALDFGHYSGQLSAGLGQIAECALAQFTGMGQRLLKPGNLTLNSVVRRLGG